MYLAKQILIKTPLNPNFVMQYSAIKCQDLKNIFLKSVASVNPQTLIKNNVQLNGNTLHVCDNQYEVKNNCYVVGFGKAVLGMASELEAILGSHLVRGIVSVPVDILSSNPNRQMSPSRITYLEGAKNNLPDAAAENAAGEISRLVRQLDATDLLIVLISGGGSALLPLPKSPVTLTEKTRLVKLLSDRGADILDLNCVRKRLSTVKGGGLAALAYPAAVCSLILSDVIGDPLECIASGPTVPNRDPSDAAIKIIEKYALLGQLPDSISRLLQGAALTSSPRWFDRVTNVVIGNNGRAVSAAARQASLLGYLPCVISASVSGDVALISQSYARLSVELARLLTGASSKESLQRCLQDIQPALNISDATVLQLLSLEVAGCGGVCLVAGGEPTVAVTGRGRGGRNQQLALQFSVDVNKLLQQSPESVGRMNISLLSAGTDGIDGPTDAAGAVGFGALCHLARAQDINPVTYLRGNDSHNFFSRFQQGQYLIRTGHTGTNVMDVHVLVISRHAEVELITRN